MADIYGVTDIHIKRSLCRHHHYDYYKFITEMRQVVEYVIIAIMNIDKNTKKLLFVSRGQKL